MDWCQAFVIYMAAMVSHHPSATLELLAYQYDGLYWRAYDTNYRLTAAATGNRTWSRLDTDLLQGFSLGGHVWSPLAPSATAYLIRRWIALRPRQRQPENVAIRGLGFRIALPLQRSGVRCPGHGPRAPAQNSILRVLAPMVENASSATPVASAAGTTQRRPARLPSRSCLSTSRVPRVRHGPGYYALKRRSSPVFIWLGRWTVKLASI